MAATVKVTDPSGTQTLEVRKSKDDYYAKSSVVEGVHKAHRSDLDQGFDKKLDDFRNKKLFDFGFNDPTQDRDQGRREDRRAYEKSGDKWTSARQDHGFRSVQALIDKLRDLSATKFVDTGFTTPAIEMTVVSKRRQAHREGPDRARPGKDFLARREGDATLYQIDARR